MPFVLSNNELFEIAEKKQFQYLDGRIAELFLNKQTSESQSTIFPFDTPTTNKESITVNDKDSSSGALQILCNDSPVGSIIGNPIFFPHLGIISLSNKSFLYFLFVNLKAIRFLLFYFRTWNRSWYDENRVNQCS